MDLTWGDWALIIGLPIASVVLLLFLWALGEQCPPTHPWRDRKWLKDGKVATKFREWFR